MASVTDPRKFADPLPVTGADDVLDAAAPSGVEGDAVASATDVRSPESGADHFRYVAPPLRHPKAHTRSTTVERSAGQ